MTGVTVGVGGSLCWKLPMKTLQQHSGVRLRVNVMQRQEVRVAHHKISLGEQASRFYSSFFTTQDSTVGVNRDMHETVTVC